MCIQVLRMDSSKGIPFCGLDVAASKGYFCSVQPGAAWGQAPGGQGGRGAGSVLELAILRVYCKFLCLREMLYR